MQQPTKDAEADIRYRRATKNDAALIFSVLEEVAGEIPVLLDNPERKNLVFAHVQTCCDSGESWMALTTNDRVVGFLLAEPDAQERFFQANQALHLPFGGVSRNHRGQHIFSTLAEKIMAKGVPLTGTVKRANKSGMAGRLLKLGFAIVSSGEDEDRLRWQP